MIPSAKISNCFGTSGLGREGSTSLRSESHAIQAAQKKQPQNFCSRRDRGVAVLRWQWLLVQRKLSGVLKGAALPRKNRVRQQNLEGMPALNTLGFAPFQNCGTVMVFCVISSHRCHRTRTIYLIGDNQIPMRRWSRGRAPRLSPFGPRRKMPTRGRIVFSGATWHRETIFDKRVDHGSRVGEEEVPCDADEVNMNSLTS